MKPAKSRAFFVETLIITFLLLALLTVLVRVFGEASRQSQSADRMTKAAQIIQNAEVMFQNSEGSVKEVQERMLSEARDIETLENPSGSVTLHFSDDGVPVEDGNYIVQLDMTCENRVAGYMLIGYMTIAHKSDPEQVITYVDTAKYYPDEEIEYVGEGGEVSIEEFEEVSG